MRFPLRRFYQDERQTLGTLTVGAVTLFTIERPWLENQPNVSCIPAGPYEIKLVWVDNERKLRLAGACIPSERTLINVEVANYASELEGCIGVGEGVTARGFVPDRQYMVTESAAAYELLLSKLSTLTDSSIACTLQISDPWE